MEGFTLISLNPPDNSLRLDNYLHFTDGEAEAQRDEKTSASKSHS